MQLNIYFQDDILAGLVADVVLVMDTARVHGALNTEYLRGVVSLAKAQAVSYGVPWRVFADLAKETLSKDNLGLLEAVL